MNKCDGCSFCSDPEILAETHYLKDKSYTSVKIISRCLATEHKYIIGCVMAEMNCKRNKKMKKEGITNVVD